MKLTRSSTALIVFTTSSLLYTGILTGAARGESDTKSSELLRDAKGYYGKVRKARRSVERVNGKLRMSKVLSAADDGTTLPESDPDCVP